LILPFFNPTFNYKPGFSISQANTGSKIPFNRQKKHLEIKTFGNFTILYEGKAVKFSRTLMG